MKNILVIIIFLVANNLFAGNPVWTSMDKKMIKKLVKIDKDSIHHYESYFLGKNKEKVMLNLGFGWKVWAPTKPGGYITLSSEFYYFNDSLVSFKISPELPSEDHLRKKYIAWYDNYFHISVDNQIYPLLFNFERLSAPLDEYSGTLKSSEINRKVMALMYPSPYLLYAWAGGYSNSMPHNRKMMMELSDSISFEELNYLTYSINPVTRFLAYEEMIRQNLVSMYGESDQNEWIRYCFLEIPTIETLNGCIGSTENTRQLVYYFSQMKYR